MFQVLTNVAGFGVNEDVLKEYLNPKVVSVGEARVSSRKRRIFVRENLLCKTLGASSMSVINVHAVPYDGAGDKKALVG